MKKITSTIMTFTLFSLLLTVSALAVKTMDGIIKEPGYGKYSVETADGTEFLLHVSKRETTFTPELWRPAKGDQISADYYEKTGRNGTIIVIRKIELVKAGPNTINITSPVNVTIVETGRSGFKTTLDDYNDIDKKFARFRGTKTNPAGWVPRSGDKAVITFHVQKARFTFNVAYLADEVKKAD